MKNAVRKVLPALIASALAVSTAVAQQSDTNEATAPGLYVTTDEGRTFLQQGEETIALAEVGKVIVGIVLVIGVVLATLAGVIAAATFNLVPIAVAALVGCVFLMITGTLKPRQAYRSVDWSLLFLIYSTLSLGLAMQQTGAAE